MEFKFCEPFSDMSTASVEKSVCDIENSRWADPFSGTGKVIKALT